MLGVLLGRMAPSGRIRMNQNVVVDVRGPLADRFHIHVLLVELLLEVLDVAPVLHIDETDGSHVLASLFG